MRFLILLLVVAGACTRSETSSPEQQPQEAQAGEAAEPAERTTADPPGEATRTEAQEASDEAAPGTDADAPPTIELLDAGKPPRKALRATFEPGAKQTLQVKSDWIVMVGFGPMLTVKTPMPSLAYELATETMESTNEGTRFEFRVTKIAMKSGADVKPGQVDAAKKAIDSLKGATGSFSINARGIVEAFAVDAPSNATLFVHDMIDQVERALRLTSLPLPEEPIGKGATWTASQAIKSRGASSRQTSTFELLGVKGKQVRAKVTYKAETPKQPLQMPGSGDGTRSLQLDGLDFEGQGKGSWKLGQLASSSASEELATGFKMMTTTDSPEVVLMGIETTIEVKAVR